LNRIKNEMKSKLDRSLFNYFYPIAIALISIYPSLVSAQTPTLPAPDFQRPAPTPSEPPQPILPPLQEILPVTPTPNLPNQIPPVSEFPEKITVQRFEVNGSTVFSATELSKITAPLTNKPIDFAQLLQVANDITQLYTSKGYVNSGAYIPGDQSFGKEGAVVKIAIVEGSVEDIVITGNQRLDPNYIKSRIALGAGKPLKIDRLIERLQILQQDPLIKSLATELTAGKTPGTSVIQIKVAENPTWIAGVTIANNRTPSIGEIQALFNITQTNLTGLGDGLNLSYGKSEGSNSLDLNYNLPVNPNNGTVRLQYSTSNSRVVESPFDRLDINGTAQDIALSYRQPLLQTPSQEFALGVTLNHRVTDTGYLRAVIGDRIGYPSPGANANGVTRLTAIRFSQDYVTRDTQQVFAARSQVSVGINALNSTNNSSSPDGKFLTWRGQAQYVRALAPNSIFLAKVESQLADRPLVPLEQIGFGGQDTVRGYRQDLLLGDNGVLASIEARFPLFSTPDRSQLLQIAPFFDMAWIGNKPGNTPSPRVNTIASTGVGLRYQTGDNFSAKLDYGIPFTAIEGGRRTGQEKGFYFSLNYNRSF
jgi:hemolysin activation/secretion protein